MAPPSNRASNNALMRVGTMNIRPFIIITSPHYSGAVIDRPKVTRVSIDYIEKRMTYNVIGVIYTMILTNV